MHRIATRQIIDHPMVCNKRNVKHETICWIGLVDIMKGLSNTKNRAMKVLLFLWNQFEQGKLNLKHQNDLVFYLTGP